MSWVPDRGARRMFYAYLARGRHKGEKVTVLKPLSKEGSHMCAVLQVDGMQMRVLFSR